MTKIRFERQDIKNHDKVMVFLSQIKRLVRGIVIESKPTKGAYPDNIMYRVLFKDPKLDDFNVGWFCYYRLRLRTKEEGKQDYD